MFEDLIKLPRTAEVLGRYGMEVRNGYQDKLIEHNRIANGRLLNSIEFFTEIDGNNYEVYLRLEDYWKYVENDTVPHMPPVNKILEWVRVKPVLPRPKDGRLPTPEGLAWAIARTIEKEGTEGTLFHPHYRSTSRRPCLCGQGRIRTPRQALFQLEPK